MKISQQLKNDKEKQDYLFFVIDKETKKTYLIKSIDNLLIGSIIHFYAIKDNPAKVAAYGLETQENNDPEYSGVIEIAVCKKNSISKYHSSLKSYTFKKQFLIIKHGRFTIFDMKIKDNINLSEYNANVQTQLNILPQPNQFIFSLQKTYKNNNLLQPNITPRGGTTNINSISGHRSDPAHNEGAKTNFYSSPKSHQESFGGLNPVYEDLKVVEYKNANPRGGFFSSILGMISSSRKKYEKIVLACDTEMKRRQWILTLKYFSQIAQRNVLKASFNREDFGSMYEDTHLTKNSFHHELDNNDKSKKRRKAPISFKPKAAHNPDFVNVYQDGGDIDDQKDADNEKIQPEDIEDRIPGSKRSLPLMTEPDASQRLGNL